MMRVLVDSDVVISAMLQNEVQRAVSEKLMDALDAREFIGVTTPVIMANIQYVLGRKWGGNKRVAGKKVWVPDRPKVVQAMQAILQLFSEMIPVDMADFYASMASKFEDLEDGVQHFAAVRAKGIDAIVTNNGKDYGHSAISHYSPGDFITEHLT